MKSSPNITKWKFRRLHKPSINFMKLIERKIFSSLLYEFALQSIEAGKVTYKQLEACRRALRRGLGKKVSILFHVSIIIPVSKKPIAVRMGKGKGNISCWIALIKAGKILFEINCFWSVHSCIILKRAASKLPVKTVILYNNNKINI